MSLSPFSCIWSALSGKHLHLQEPPPPPPSSQLRAASAAPPAAQQSPPSKPQRRLFRSENKLAKIMIAQCRHLAGLIIVSKFKIQRTLNLIGINSAQPQRLNNWSKSRVSLWLINYPDGISRPQTTTTLPN